MALSVATSLQTLLWKLSAHTDIQNDLQQLITEGKQISAKFSSVISNKLTEIQRQKSLLVSASSPSEVHSGNIQAALKTARELFIENKQELVKMQGTIHISVERCRSRKASDEAQLVIKREELNSIRREINQLEFRIKIYEEEIETLNKSAEELDNRASYLNREADRKKDIGILGGLLSVGVGLIFAPFTGGVSLVAASAMAGLNAGINFGSASECLSGARRMRHSASNKRTEANTCLTQQLTTYSKKYKLERQISTLERHREELEETSRDLSDITRFLLESVDVTNRCIDALQDVDMAMKDAELQGDAFIIIQAAFTKNPEKLNVAARKYMDKLKGKWHDLEQVLRQNKAIE